MSAFGGKFIVSSSRFRAYESLKYVFCSFTIGWSWVSNHCPIACGALAQSEQTGRVEIGVLCSFTVR